jgi:MFS transporter, DHA1 family, multidrug resistance protein
MSEPMTVPSGKPPVPVGRLAIILGTLAMFGPFGTDMYLSGFSKIAEDLHTSVANVQITLSVYFIGLAIGQMIYGPLIDRFGRRIPLLVGLSLFIVSSILIALAPNIQCFIALRLLQALGGCAGMITGRAVVRDLFDLKGSANMLSILAIVQGLGPIIAPVLGSFMLTVLPWQSLFVFTAFFGAFCMAESIFGLPETLPPEARRDIHFKQVFSDYWSLATRRSFIVPATASGLAMSCLFAYISGSSFVFMHIYGLSARQYGLVFACNALGTIFAAQINRWLLRHFEPRQVLTGGFVFNICVVAALVFAAGNAPMAAFMIPLWLCIASLPLIFANAIAIAMDAGHDKSGSASALIGLLQFVFASLASLVVSFLHNGTAYPMACVMLGGVTLGALANALTPRTKSAAR